MTDRELPDDLDAARLSRDLKAAYRPNVDVPQSVDEAVLRSAGGRVKLVSARRRLLRWAPMAAAAAIVLAAWMGRGWFGAAPTRGVAAVEDVNGDGRVDVLDAFALARHLRGAANAGSFRDVNSDGVIDERDVDRIAAVAVDLKRGRFQ